MALSSQPSAESNAGVPLNAGFALKHSPERLASPPGDLPQYDVRVTRELAHRRSAVSLARRVLRLASLHTLDALSVAGATWSASYLVGAPPLNDVLPSMVAFVLIGLNLRGAYRSGGARRDAGRLVTGVLIGVAIALIPTTVREQPGPEFLAILAVAAIALLVVERLGVNALVGAAYAHGLGLRRAAVVAHAEEYRQLLLAITPHRIGRPSEDQVIIGHISPDSARDPMALGTIADLADLLEAHDVSELILATTLRAGDMTRAAEECFSRGVRVLVLPPAPPRALRAWAEPTRIGSVSAFQLLPTRVELPALMVKRVADFALAAVGLALALPLFAVVAVCIKAESHGPVFFRQRRVGLGGRLFQMWKFRSMWHEAESRRDEVKHLNAYGDHRLFKLANDPRITRVGRFLRRFSLDELPQLFNVLAGDMSLVGPRPPLPSEVSAYEPHHMVRLSVVPGLTGPWQVGGRNLITDFEEVVRLERRYIEGWSLRADIEIMLRTVGVVLSGEGAY